MKAERIFLYKALENIALTAGITVAAIHFDSWKLLWFYVIVLLNGVSSVQTSGTGGREE